jgi:lysozyme family protein
MPASISPAFQRCLPFVLRWEGGLVDDPADPGGRTNKGITQRVYDAWRDRQGLDLQDVALIAIDEVEALYAADYWQPPGCMLLAPSLDLVQLDTAVNTGPNRAVRFLQTALGCVPDGRFGPRTRAAAQGCDSRATLLRYIDLREAFYRDLVGRRPELRRFLRGWLNRVADLRRTALSRGDACRREVHPVPSPRIPDLPHASLPGLF